MTHELNIKPSIPIKMQISYTQTDAHAHTKFNMILAGPNG